MPWHGKASWTKPGVWLMTWSGKAVAPVSQCVPSCSGITKGALADSNEWYLKTIALDPDDSFSQFRLAINFAAISEFDEARHLAPEAHWLVNAIEQRWSEAISQARKSAIENPRDNLAIMRLANVFATCRVTWLPLRNITSACY